ncbi:type I restriction endonuclease subunit R [Gulosibacter molinativorax]|uniref:Type I restriction endonuclease subunit R n=1 Tax=Gulosibacter molinativorax TaxID=256821 RepID=A0ABT7C9J3_9MICO|nr:type I restriction endonuclease [Gulosibacter molinativorax]MDJ1371886.1 type I restriction endonuclease subunit R [Gulosibacter molinativorax]QUY62533.1 Type I restriction-modification system restriction subunit [Gulosibacter molinativorax]
MNTYRERAFQDEIADYLGDHGWLRSENSAGYDKERALYPEDLLGWLEDIDPKNYAKIVPTNATPEAKAKGERRILDRVVKKLANDEAHGGGTLATLRNGFDVTGARHFDLLQMPPADGRNPNLIERYAKNRLRVVPEVVYSMKKADRIDLVLFVNGIPVATLELKTTFTQSVNDAVTQYRKDRNPKGEPLLTEFRGALVHFAVTDNEVQMTTKLEGKSTTFLPFNRGYNNGAGNPPVEGKHRTSYLWEEVFERDTWLSILAKFIYVNHQTKVNPVTGEITEKASVRFPRYHQWRAVTKLTQHAHEHGSGQNYLIQHSAGSGKTDSIAWTAHRMATLHTPYGKKVFDGVIVVADRDILDRQLQDAVDQLVSKTGTFLPVTRGSEGSKTEQLLEALRAQVLIIGVTLQTFPHALKRIRDEGGELAGKRFAVIADEAHSSQTGESAASLRELLYQGEVPASIEGDEIGADQDALVAMAARADSDKRLSFFAFTATPKAKTLEKFGRTEEGGEPKPFDLYSMKQAIEEGFILDVLKNYTTYEFAARIALRAEEGESEEVDVRKGTRAYIGFVELHPTNVASKVDVILRHYRETVQKELGGRAKAMVVTASRAAAVKYARAFEKAIERDGLPLKTLVAFSGEVPDPDVTALPGIEVPTVTEASMNPELRGGDLAKVFAREDQNILIVANKYQTGFDQPLLVGMYVDKKLSGITAVQTLSRLNRRADGKDNTYVLDFVNDGEDVRQAFLTYYEDAEIQTESDPDLVLDLSAKLEQQKIFTRSEVQHVWDIWTETRSKHSALDSAFHAPVDRFSVRWHDAVVEGDDEAREQLEDFRSTLAQYVKAYAFFSQILDYGEPYFEKLSVFADLLARKLREFRAGEANAANVDVTDVVLTHYKLEKVRDEDLRLESGAGEGLRGMTEAGLAKVREQERSAKSELIEAVNKYFGDLDVSDEYKVDMVGKLLAETAKSEDLLTQSVNNVETDFRFSPKLNVVVDDARWQYDEAQNSVAEAIREMPIDRVVNMLLDAGLYEYLRERAG